MKEVIGAVLLAQRRERGTRFCLKETEITSVAL